MRDVAYSQIPRADRGRKHVAAAEWVESMAGERVTDHSELLAYHYEQALELAKAAGDATETSRLQEPPFGSSAWPAIAPDLWTFRRQPATTPELLDFAPDDLQRARALLKLADVAAAETEGPCDAPARRRTSSSSGTATSWGPAKRSSG